MTNRLKNIFIALNKKQSEISRETTIDQATLSYMLSGKRTITNRTIRLICLTYNVNETWLRYGKGEMFNKSVPPRNRTDQEIAEEYLLNALDCLTPEYQEYFKNVCQKFLEKQNKFE